jgi:peroxiredoxin
VGYDKGVGRQAPAFTITAADGGEIELKQYRGDWYPVLVFASAAASGLDRLLAQLSSSSAEFWGLRGQLLGIVVGSAEDVRALAGRIEGLSFPLLPDDGSVATMYGAVKPNGRPRLMVVVVDRAGKIVWQADDPAQLDPAVILDAFRRVVR